MKSGIIIQAHIPSTRLPGKILKEVDRFTILERVLDACTLSGFDKVVVATTTNPENDILEEVVKKYNDEWNDNVLLFRYAGLESDVLGRYYEAAKKYELDTICRITSDCPLISTDIIYLCKKAFEYYEDTEYLSFLSIDGMDTEIFDFRAFERAYHYINKLKWSKKTQDDEKEHVTRFLRESGLFNTKRLEDIKISIDTEEDFERIRRICQR